MISESVVFAARPERNRSRHALSMRDVTSSVMSMGSGRITGRLYGFSFSG
jgi:hypothetical protein